MRFADISANDVTLRREGSSLLTTTGIESLLSRFGTIVIGGSYVYKTMVDRDIDISVVMDDQEITDEISPLYVSSSRVWPE